MAIVLDVRAGGVDVGSSMHFGMVEPHCCISAAMVRRNQHIAVPILAESGH